jgi:penicillin-binding protein 1A
MVVLSLGAIFWVYGRDLPSHAALAKYTPPTISRIYSGEGRIIDEFAKERRLFVPIEEVPDVVKNAFISAEDKNFYLHAGYDLRGIAAAAVEGVLSGGQTLRGASTITQQVMKYFLLSGDRRIERKIKEIILATRIEETLTKDEILELYMNEIFLGQNSYGVAAASQTYFNKPLSALAPHEAAFLASMPKAPGAFHPVRRKDRLLQRRNFVLKEMKENGYITEDVYEAEVQLPLKSVQNGDYESFRVELPPRDYFTDEIRRQLSRDFGEGEFFSGGLTVRATIDPEMQQAATNSLRKALEDYDRAQGHWRGTGIVLSEDQLADGVWQEVVSELELPRDIDLNGKWRVAVVSMLGNFAARIKIEDVPDDEDGHWILAEDVTWASAELIETDDGDRLGPKAKVAKDLLKLGEVVYVREKLDENGESDGWTLRQVPEIQGGFMAMDVNNGRVLAMQGGFNYENSVFNRTTQAKRQPGSSFKPFVYAAALDSGYSPATIVVDAPIEIETPEGFWRPKNSSDKFYGPSPVRTGIEQSKNLMTIRLARDAGMELIADYAERFGVYDEMNPFLANSLGAEETTLFRMVAAYAMFANGGERVEPTLVDRVQDRYGQTVYLHDRRDCVDCTIEDLEAGTRPEIVSYRERVMDEITAYQLVSMLQGAVERGTGARYIDLPVPTAGKTGTTNEARDVWFIGFTSNIVAGCYIGYDVPTPLGRGWFGGSTCGPVFQRFMEKAVEKYGGGQFVVPNGGQFINMDRFTGARLPEDAEGDNVVAEYFRIGDEPVFGVSMTDSFAMGSNLKSEAVLAEEAAEAAEAAAAAAALNGATGETTVVPDDDKADFGTLSSGGLY